MKKNWSTLREKARKLLHIGFGASLILLLYLLSYFTGFENARSLLTLALGLMFFAGLYFIDRKAKGLRAPVIDELLELLERPQHPPGYGAFWYGAGAIALFAFLSAPEQIASGLFILAFGDSLASLVGSKGRHALSYNPGKTLEGAAAFFLISCFTFFFIGWHAIPLALLASLVESFNLHLDDNFTIPLACIAFFKLFG